MFRDKSACDGDDDNRAFVIAVFTTTARAVEYVFGMRNVRRKDIAGLFEYILLRAKLIG